MTWNLFIDDERNPKDTFEDWTDWHSLEWVVARSSAEAIELVKKNGVPERLALDFNLGYGDNILMFIEQFRKHSSTMPEYRVHSAWYEAYYKIEDFVQRFFLTNKQS